MTDEYSANPSRITAPTLQRGKACLRCRSRCDGTKPSCQQCNLCEYDDGKGKTRTQLLRETIARLEARIKELESPEHTSTSVSLFDPHALAVSEDSSSSGADSPSSFPFSASQSPNPHPLGTCPPCSHVHLCLAYRIYPRLDRCFPGSPPMVAPQLPSELAHSLLETFIPHRDQLFFGLHVDRLRNSLRRPAEQQRHPMLMNAIFLWACYFSRTPTLNQHESLYLSRATDSFHDWLRSPSKVVDVIQGCSLLSQYFLVNGRIMEGSHYASTAASLALQWGLHRQGSERRDVGLSLEGTFFLPPAQDAIERGERILAFWQVFCLDRCWSAALHRPSLISDGPCGLSSIIVPWPQDIIEYQVENFGDLAHLNTVQSFLAHQIQVPVLADGFSNYALRAKASALFDLSSKVSSSWNAAGVALTPLSEQEMLAVEESINRFIASIIPVHQIAAVHAGDRHNLIVVHTLAQAALIRLSYFRGEVDQLWNEKCLIAARGMLLVIGQVSEIDLEFLDPIVACCWASAAHVFIREIAQVESWSSIASNELGSHVGTITTALSRLNMTFPLAGIAQ
ncbi:hypothetical protein F5148DRAFT_1252352 [Russula earlei]|uniref:Uncharacterized protein n=1 Tax=Russula earlei TaxID=71964 RepID=A0ACC0TTC2_9AGAM|nr:hypothetical protein F5148DRAFT_1252352 [Russula earlei]